MTTIEPTSLDIAKATLLAPFGLDQRATDSVFGTILAHRADDADLFFQYNRSEGWTLEEGEVKSGSYSIDQGVGVRVVAGEKTAFAYSDDIHPEALLAAARVTRAIAADGGDARIAAPAIRTGTALYAPIDPVAQFDDAAKVRILETIERFARAGRSAREAGDRAAVGRVRRRAGGTRRRRPRRRRAAARASHRHGDRRAGWAPRAGLSRRRRTFRLRVFHR
jgi:hypothetical protein